MTARPSIVVLHGSPKGEVSVTYQYVRWLKRARPDADFHVFQAAQRVEQLERGGEQAQALLDAVAGADLVLLATPVYICLVPSQYQRFLEWLAGHAQNAAPRAAVLTTSVHFYDHLAREHLEQTVRDLGWTLAGSFTAEMHDLLNPSWRRQLETFFAHALQPAPAIAGDVGRKVVVLSERSDAGAGELAEAFRAEFPEAARPELLHLEDFGLKSGCLGCLRCGLGHQCVHQGRDQLDAMAKRVRGAEAVIVAASIQRGMIGWRWKQLVDRLFRENHVPLLRGQVYGFLLAGELAEAATLREALRVYVGYGEAHLVGIASGTSAEAGRRARELARETARTVSDGYRAPPSSETIGGHKIIRDALWGGLRRVYPAEHAQWQREGLYDFPRYGLRARARDWVLSLPGPRKRYQNALVQRLVEPFRQLFD